MCAVIKYAIESLYSRNNYNDKNFAKYTHISKDILKTKSYFLALEYVLDDTVFNHKFIGFIKIEL